MKQKLSKDIINYLKTNATVINNGEIYYHLPQWFKKTANENVFEVLFENDLPFQTNNNLKISTDKHPFANKTINDEN